MCFLIEFIIELLTQNYHFTVINKKHELYQLQQTPHILYLPQFNIILFFYSKILL